MRAEDDAPKLSRAYLLALRSMAEITKEPIIEHFKTDAYYRYLLSTSEKRSGKRSRKDAIEDDAGDLSVLMDAPTKRPRLGRGGGGRGRGGVPGHFIPKMRDHISGVPPC